MQQNNRNRIRFIYLLIGMVVLVGFISACGSSQEDGVVATYDGGEVTKEEFTNHKEKLKVLYGDTFTQWSLMDQNFEQTILTQFVGFKLLGERATDEQYEEAKQMSESEWKEIRNAYEEQGRLEAFEERIKSANIKEKDMIEVLTNEIASLLYYRDQVEDEQIQAYYDELLEENEHVFDRVSVRHVLIQTFNPQTEEEMMPDEEALALANEVRQKYLDGESFGDLVAEYSDDLASVPMGGLMEDADINMFVENFKHAAMELPLNEISEPIKTEYGYHVMIVEGRRTVEFDEVKDGIQIAIAQEEHQRFMTDELPKLIDEESINFPKDNS